jgi:adenylate cyclase
VFVGYNLLCGVFFTRANVVMPMAAPNVALVASALAILVYRLSTEERHRSQITRTFGLFVPPQVVSQLTGEDARVARLEAERREITVLFSDIRDFTAYSERTDAEDVVALLNRYFSLMHEVVWEFGGTLDKYMGDGLMAFFGAPTSQEDHPERAVLAAVEMQRVIGNHADEWASFGMEGLRVGMGLHTGEVLVGLTGSEGRMQYTCMGDAVNLASRLEESTRDLDAEIIISSHLYERVADTIEAEPIGRLKIRGISAEVMAYAVGGRRDPQAPGAGIPRNE